MAVYTPIVEEELEAFLRDYDLGAPIAFKGIAEGVENSNFFLQTERGRYILTLFEKRVARDDVPFFLALMEHLNGAGIACPSPVKDRSGAALRELKARPAAIVTFLDGVAITKPGPAHCRALGEGLADMHGAVEDFRQTRANALSLDGWAGLADACRARADEVEPGLAKLIDADLEHLKTHWPSALPRGVIHADLFPDNVFFLSGRLSGFIDFYFACTDFFAYDLAVCLNAWCFDETGEIAIENARALIGGYQTHRTLSEAEIAALPVLARGAAMRFLLTRLFDWLNQVDGALVLPKDPREYLRKLRFHRSVKTAAALGVE